MPDTGDRLGKVTSVVMPHNTASITMFEKDLADRQRQDHRARQAERNR
ncbi:MAG TPA: hypothetical protein VGJ54_09605 [Streptosporangiaceae bacterium]